MQPAYRVTIHKGLVEENGKQELRWIASGPEYLLDESKRGGSRGPKRGEVVEWMLEAPKMPPPESQENPVIVAHIQFTDMHLFEKLDGGQFPTPDMTAEVRPGANLQLKMKGYLPANRDPRRHYYYAIWVQEGTQGSFAVGHTLNPPPEVTMGP